MIHRASVQPFLKKYCYECHSDKKQKGDVRFDTIDWKITDNVTAQNWQDVLDVLNAGDMPPEDEPQPTDTEFSQIVGVLTNNLDAARDRLDATGGVNPIRRLNKREYLNSVKQLMGINVHESFVPDDIRGEHFDTTGNDQYLDGPLIETYLRMGTKISREGLTWATRPYAKPETTRREGESYYHKRVDYNFYKEDYPKSDTGIYPFRGYRYLRGIGMKLGDDPRASYKLRVHAAVHDRDHPRRHFLELYKQSAIRGLRTPTIGVLKVTGTLEKPSTSEVLIPREALSNTTEPSVKIAEVMPLEITNPDRWFPIYLNSFGANRNSPSIWLDWLEVEGPFYDSQTSVLHQLLSPEGENLGGPENARAFLEKFTYEAFRHVEPGVSYINRLTNYFGLRMKEGLGYEEAMSETLGLVLTSPSFLYLEAPEQSNTRHLDARALATRLAYFLWSAPPDEELYAAAKAGDLLKTDTLKKQVTRMLKDPRSDSFFDGFMSQWAEIDRFLDISIDWRNNLKFNRGVRYSAAREPIEFFKTLVLENLPVDHLIDSPFVVVDSNLAQYYDLPGKHNFSGFKKIPLPRGSSRGGYITQSAFLTMGSNGIRTSPVIRGTLILEKILHNPPPQPPPNVPEIESASDKPLSNRDLVSRHREQRVCASCHDKIDPIGFGLENFDTVGLWRDTEPVGKQQVPVESGGTLASGITFDNLQELQVLLKSAEDKLAQNIIESLTSYAIGRPIEFTDQKKIEELVTLAKKQNFQLQDIITLVVTSETFRSK